LLTSCLPEPGKEDGEPQQQQQQQLSLSFTIDRFQEDETEAEETSRTPIFRVAIADTCRRERVDVPFIIQRCVEQVELRGIDDVGIYRVSGSSTEINTLSAVFDADSKGTQVKDVEINTVSGLLKQYLRHLPECLFTNELYPHFIKAYYSLDMNLAINETNPDTDNLDPSIKTMLSLFSSLPTINKKVIIYLLEHLVRVGAREAVNKMTLQNIATVFGPTLLHAEVTADALSGAAMDMLDVVAQAGVLHFFLARVSHSLPIQLPAPAV